MRWEFEKVWFYQVSNSAEWTLWALQYPTANHSTKCLSSLHKLSIVCCQRLFVKNSLAYFNNFKKHLKRRQDKSSDSPLDVRVLMKMLDGLTDELVKESWGNVWLSQHFLWQFCTHLLVNGTWLGKSPYLWSAFTLGCASVRKAGIGALLSINLPKQPWLPFALSIIFLLRQFGDVFCNRKPDNIPNMSTKRAVMFPDNTWLLYLCKHSDTYIYYQSAALKHTKDYMHGMPTLVA